MTIDKNDRLTDLKALREEVEAFAKGFPIPGL